MAHWDNKTLTTTCASCAQELTTFVDPDTTVRKTWPLVGEKNGQPHTYAACTKCYESGWRPPAYAE
jgi:hypothetical protein